MSDRKRLARIERALEKSEQAARRQMMISRAEVAILDSRLASVLDQCQALPSNPDLPMALGRALIESGWSAAAAIEDERRHAATILEARHDLWTERHVRLDGLRRLVARREAIELESSRLREARELQDLVSIAGSVQQQPVQKVPAQKAAA